MPGHTPREAELLAHPYPWPTHPDRGSHRLARWIRDTSREQGPPWRRSRTSVTRPKTTPTWPGRGLTSNSWVPTQAPHVPCTTTPLPYPHTVLWAAPHWGPKDLAHSRSRHRRHKSPHPPWPLTPSRSAAPDTPPGPSRRAPAAKSKPSVLSGLSAPGARRHRALSSPPFCSWGRARGWVLQASCPTSNLHSAAASRCACLGDPPLPCAFPPL